MFLDANPLLSALYAKEEENIEQLCLQEVHLSNFLWSFRDRVSVETLPQLISTNLNANLQDTCTLLREFVAHEHLLRALRFLPDILRLQRLLVRRFNNSIDSAEANSTSLSEFLQQVDESKRPEMTGLIESFLQAWQLCSSRLKASGKFVNKL